MGRNRLFRFSRAAEQSSGEKYGWRMEQSFEKLSF
jgi:hypothetical protein